mmetsp:Transcript_33149/g.80536  ORF Transcript_33149/g.80536 Transcript_33149/m.80536 type:complete len:2346 (-) Transcript_33149:253-7290(-)
MASRTTPQGKVIPRTMSWPSLFNPAGGSVYDSIEQYVKAKGGKRVIQRILIANNGIAAVKGIRSMQKWAYETFGDEKILQFICMATPDDIKVNAEYIHLANEVVNVPGGSNNNNYANVSLIIDIAERLKADAVWAGWGHASENPKLPDGLTAHNLQNKQQIVWIGPPANAMRALGDKIGSSLIAQSAGVPCIGWSGSHLQVDLKAGGSIPDDVYKKACVQDYKEAITICRKIGFPVMIKASEGGGGKGIRMCHSEEEVKEKFGQVVGEVAGSPVFIMKLAPTCRHLEVQLLGDEWGNAIAVHGRDCSIQRRHQKIIEEGPVVAAKKDIWRKMEQSAVRLAKAVGYVGAGTVEYLYTQDNSYYFLELNPRLQVEHPVTELISGVNLPAAQLQLAMGLPLYAIPHIRRFYGKNVEDITPINFDSALPHKEPRHVIACRITAENPEMEFQPTSGTIFHLNFRSTPHVWGYFSVSSNGGVHQFADSQFGHLFATAKTRESARKNMVQALKELSIQGEIRTTVEYLCHILETRDFIENQVSTNWLETAMKDKTISDSGKLDPNIVVTLGALYRGWAAANGAQKGYIDFLGRGQVPPTSDLQHTIETNVDLIYQLTKYKTFVTRSGPRHFDIQLKHTDWTASVEVHELADQGLLAMMDGKRYIVYGREQPDGLRLSIDSKTYMFSRDYDPTRLIAEMQGKLVRYTVEDGGHVRKNKAYAEMEVMKMYIALVAPEDGKLVHCKPEGAILEGGDLIAKLELDDPSSIQTATLFSGNFPKVGPPQPIGEKPNLRLEMAILRLTRLLSGYKLGKGRRQEAVRAMMDALRDPWLPCHQFNDIMSTISAKLPTKLVTSLTSINNRYRQSLTSHRFHWEKHDQFPSPEMLEVIQTQMVLLESKEQGALSTVLEPLMAFLKLYIDGNHAYAVHIVTKLLDKYYEVESHFKGPSELVIKHLRHQHLNDGEKVLQIARAHYQVADRNDLVFELFKIMCDHLRPLLTKFDPILRKIATLEGPDQTQVSIKARKVIMAMSQPTFEQRKVELEAVLKTAYNLKAYADRSRVLGPLASRPGRIENLLLVDCMAHRSTNVRRMAMEAYILRNHSDYGAEDVVTSTDYGFMLARFKSKTLDGAKNAAGGGLYEDVLRSYGDSSQISSSVDVHAMVAFFSDETQLKSGFKLLLKENEADEKQESKASVDGNRGTVRTVYLILKSDEKDDEKASSEARDLLQANQERLFAAGVARVTLVVAFRETSERLFTFRASNKFQEDRLIRHLRPLMAAHIDLRRMKNFKIRLAHSDGTTKLLEAVPHGAKPGRDGYDGRRLFLRRVVQHFTASDLVTDKNAVGNQPNPETKSPRPSGAKPVDDPIIAPAPSDTTGESLFLGLVTALEIGCGEYPQKYRNNNLGILIPEPLHESEGATLEAVRKYAQVMVEQYSERLFRQLAVQAVELSVSLRSKKAGGTEEKKLLIVATNPSGYRVRIHMYQQDRTGCFKEIGKPDGAAAGPLDGEPVDAPYPVSLPFEKQRQAARRVGTVYAYDFLTLFEVALRDIWASSGATDHPMEILKMRELVLAPKEDGKILKKGALGVGVENWKLVETNRSLGSNKIAMVAWELTLRTPLYPEGRDIILIANDISVQAGSFGVLEDILFHLASCRARAKGLPRLYFAVNSGARIGLARELKYKFRVSWNADDITKGPNYLYLADADFQELKHSVTAVPVTIEDSEGKVVEKRWKIQDIIGAENGLGVENLSGSGLIAGETSKAYNEVFTLTYCCGRSVGIGAYLARLGQRVVQKRRGAPILLTGHFALNKLLGRRVYTSNDQLGGIDVMANNGVSHLVCEDDLDGVRQCLKWLSYVPKCKGQNLEIPCAPGLSISAESKAPAGKMLCNGDVLDRKVDFVPPAGPYETLHLLNGVEVNIDDEKDLDDQIDKPRMSLEVDSELLFENSTEWISGFFDRNSFMELMSDWAKTVVCGRARLGGMPVGVIAVTTKMVEQISPADPATLDSKEIIQQKAGQVWYPDSAFKTAQAIRDMDSEDMPLIIFANWRGFSGGMRDMFDEVLKFGSYIVDALVAYKQPISVYLPPHATLRGGAWVVVDSQINPYFMQMYADPRARGGILEVEATCGIKFRRKDELKTAYRLDSSLKELKAQLDNFEDIEEGKKKGDGKPTADGTQETSEQKKKRELLQQILDREQKILPSFHQAASLFVDLHDTPGRMKAKGIINEIVPWENSRTYFFWNLRKRTLMARLAKRIQIEHPDWDLFACEKEVIKLISAASHTSEAEFMAKSDIEIFNILKDLGEKVVSEGLASLRTNYIASQFKSFLSQRKNPLDHIGNFLKDLNLSKDEMAGLKTWINANV